MSTTPTHSPLDATELHQLAALEQLEYDEGLLTNREASSLAALRNRRDGADPRYPRWVVREMRNHDCVVVDVVEEARVEADWIARHGDCQEPGA